MNVTELARKLKITTKELLEILPVVGFDIGRRAIKIDDRTGRKIVEQWSQLLAAYQEKTAAAKPAETEATVAEAPAVKQVTVPSTIRVKDFAEKLKLPISKVIAELMKNGVLASLNEPIDFDTASIIGQDLGFEVVADTHEQARAETAASATLERLLQEEDQTKRKPRPPVVVVMGHVDHGKTKLLDTIRKTNVVAQESGGITQHIGAYQTVHKGKMITFIDTPGHEAFTTMRSRGARAADVAILVIAADDSIQPQTKESIKIINSAGLPMVVAINKIDKPDANPDRVKQDLAALNLAPEEWGGKTICVPISAKQGTGIDDLLEMILLVADTQAEQITANPDRPAVGTIVESHISKGEGPVATVLIQNGTLHRGDLVTIGDTFYGKVRAMKDFIGGDVSEATPSMPVKIIGLKAAASVGDILQVTADVDRKSRVSSYQLKEQATAYSKPREEIGPQENRQALNLVIKADVLGSLEAIISSLVALDHPEVSVNIIAKGLGNITEGDVQRAATGGAQLIGFHVKPTQAAEQLAREAKVELKIYQVIYHLIEEVKAKLEAMLKPEVIRTELGMLKVLAVFVKEKDVMVVGGAVTRGLAVIRSKVDVVRAKQTVATGTLAQLQMNKIAVNEATAGQECGIRFEGKPVIQVGDSLVFYTEVVKEKKIG